MGQRESVGGGQLLVPEVGPACPGSRLFPAVAGGAVPPARGSRPVGWAASRPGSDVPPLPRRMTRVDLRSYLQRIYNVPVAAVRTRVQHGGCPGLAAAPLPAARCPRGLPALPAALGPGSRPGRHGVSRPLQGSCRSQSQGRAGFGTEQGRGLAPRAAPSSRRPRPVSQAFPLSSTLSPSCPGTPAPCVVGLKAFGLRRGPPRQLCTRGSGSVFSDAAGPSRSPRRGLPSPRTRSEPKATPFGAHVLSCCRLQADRPVPTCAPPPESGALERSG